MPDRTLIVHVEIDGKPHIAGRLLTHAQGGREDASFEPDARWLASPHRHTYEPLLALAPGPFFSGGAMPLFGALGDSAPDRWGRTLLRRRERDAAERERRPGRVLREADFLACVNDASREGNLRFSERERGPFLGGTPSASVPTLRQLARLAEAVRRHEHDDATEAQAKLLLASGQLLGGSRPKATLRDHDGHLLVAKFSSRADRIDNPRWEAATLRMASDCGIAVPKFRLVSVRGERVLVLRRFDREAGTGRRVACATMMGLIGARDNKSQSYLQMADVIRRMGGRPRDDLVELWRRAVFTVLVSDKDNHLRNHGMLLERTGWRLVPAYDLVPEPEEVKPRILAMSLDGVDDRARLGPLFEHCAEFGLAAQDARAMARSIAGTVRRWREYAKALRLPVSEMRHMRAAFEHDALEEALR